jgi:hypothetical protein
VIKLKKTRNQKSKNQIYKAVMGRGLSKGRPCFSLNSRKAGAAKGLMGMAQTMENGF